MTTVPNPGPLQGPGGARAAGEPITRTTDTAASQAGPAFRALLEQLQERASALEASSQGVADPAELKGAVDAARATLEDALSLGDQVLEAYRSARATGSTTDADSNTTRGPRTTG